MGKKQEVVYGYSIVVPSLLLDNIKSIDLRQVIAAEIEKFKHGKILLLVLNLVVSSGIINGGSYHNATAY